MIKAILQYYWRSKGIYLLRRGMYQDAIENFKNVHYRIDSKDFQTHFLIGNSYQFLYQAEKKRINCTKAIKWFTKAVELDVNPVYKADALFHIGMCYEYLGAYDTALEFNNKVLDIQPYAVDAIRKIYHITKPSPKKLNEELKEVNERVFLSWTEKKLQEELKEVKEYVFLSWTEKNPREDKAMSVMKEILSDHEISYFDYTRYPVKDESVIKRILETATDKANCSVEIISADILPRHWIKYERQLLRDFKKPRLFLCIDFSYSEMTGLDEENVIRFNFSDGRLGIINVSKLDVYDKMYSDDSYFFSDNYRDVCDIFTKLLSIALLNGYWYPLKRFTRNSLNPKFLTTRPQIKTPRNY